MEVSSWEYHWFLWSIFQPAMFDCRRVPPKWIICNGKSYQSPWFRVISPNLGNLHVKRCWCEDATMRVDHVPKGKPSLVKCGNKKSICSWCMFSHTWMLEGMKKGIYYPVLNIQKNVETPPLFSSRSFSKCQTRKHGIFHSLWTHGS